MTSPHTSPGDAAKSDSPDAPSRLGQRTRAVFFEGADSLIYAAVGVCFVVAAVLSLAYAVTRFVYALLGLSQQGSGILGSSGTPAQFIVNFVSDLLLTLIITEVLGTVVHYLRTRTTSLRPFLFIGIISATRSILAVGAQLSISNSTTLAPKVFESWMIELAVNASVIIALGLTTRLIGRLLDDSFDAAAGSEPRPRRAPPSDHE